MGFDNQDKIPMNEQIIVGSFYFCKVFVEKMSIEDAKDSVDGYEGHNEQGDPNVAVVEERNVTEIDFLGLTRFILASMLLYLILLGGF